jgi:hypothetical protein
LMRQVRDLEPAVGRAHSQIEINSGAPKIRTASVFCERFFSWQHLAREITQCRVRAFPHRCQRLRYCAFHTAHRQGRNTGPVPNLLAAARYGRECVPKTGS